MEETKPNPLTDGELITQAVFRAADHLNLSQRELAGVLGVSAASLSRMANQRLTLDPAGKDGEIGLLFIRLFRSLDAVWGGHETNMRAWFDASNRALNGTPRQLIQTLRGLFDVVTYLDAMRGTV